MSDAFRTMPTDTAVPRLDAALLELRANATGWARLPLPRKIELLDGVRRHAAEAAERWVDAATLAKGLGPESPYRGEEWSSGPYALISYVGTLRRTLEHVRDGTLALLVKDRVRQRPDGQAVVRVVPTRPLDRLLFPGIEAEVWMAPGVAPADLPGTMATFYTRVNPEGSVVCVLGAGNIAAIPPLDVLYELYAEGRVGLLKMNPINAYLGPILAEVFQDFIEAGYLRIVYGGAGVGTYITRHDEVDQIHVTGSAATYDAIVFGTGETGWRRKVLDEPEIKVPVSGELGGVSPVIVVPGPWSDADLRFQAEHVATMKMHNGGFNCVAAQVLVLPDEWPLRDAFVHEVRRVLREIPDRPAYYPGADERVRTLCDAYPAGVEWLGATGARLLIPDVDPADADHHMFTSEAFSAALAVTRLPGGAGGSDASAFLARAVDFCNECLLGSLAVTILIHPGTIQQLGDGLEDAIGRLRYGNVSVNVWNGIGFFLPHASWGAFPGHDRSDIQSGSGVVHNALLFDAPQKSVVKGPFAPFPRSLQLGEYHAAPKPPWLVTNGGTENLFRRMTYFSAAPSVRKLLRVVAAGFRG
ncbi:MAG: aldehyde dehydrogenase family protein [Gemmatimonadota bacterium]